VAELTTIPVEQVQFVKELYPRLREDHAAIERYRAAIDKLPPIVVARGRVLVDGFHRWQAHKAEGATEITAQDLGNLTDVEILKESLKRNSSHGRQLETSDKKRNADLLYRQGTTDYAEIADLLSISEKTAKEYCRDARRDEKEDQKAQALDLWLDCRTQEQVAADIGVAVGTINKWVSDFQSIGELKTPPDSRQHFDVWNFQTAAGDSNYFGKMPPQVVENLLWLYTEPGQIVVDPFAGGGTTIDVAKAMGRRIFASDRKPSTPTLPIHEHDITDGWPDGAPKKADFILLDPPYWKQAAERYSKDLEDLGNMSLDDFYAAWSKTIKVCSDHLNGGFLAFIVSPAEDKENDHVEDLAFEMYAIAREHGLRARRRIIVTYNTQQATGQQVEWARNKKKLLKLYRDLVVLSQ
jgi:DNA modification methylase